jgi:putative phosphoribosyl transferase
MPLEVAPMHKTTDNRGMERSVRIELGSLGLDGNLTVPERARGVVLFAHGSGSSRHSPRNRYVARVLNEVGLATLLVDLLTPEVEAVDLVTRHLRFDVGLLAERLVGATDWLERQPETGELPVGLFGASTGAGAALIAAVERPERIAAVVSRGGRPDLAGAALPRVKAPTLLIVGGDDQPVIELNEAAFARLGDGTRLEIVPGATHLFEEPGALEQVALLASRWFERHLAPADAARASTASDAGAGAPAIG